MKEKLICGIINGQAETPQKAKKIAESYKNCPYVTFLATDNSKFYAVYFLPKRQKWWINYIEKKPQKTLGLEKAEIHYPDNIQHPKTLKMRLPKKKHGIAPCGADCSKCSSNSRCLCCPATIYYKGA
jgi:hypothetical protein